MLMEQILLISGAGIVGLLGFLHLLLTFFTHKFESCDPDVTAAMKKATLVLTKQTSMWEAWVGFNASHSLGAMLVAAFYIPLSIYHFDVIQQSLWFTLLPVFIGVSYLFLANKYWFNLPFWGIFMSTLCFALSVLKLTTT